MLPMINLFTKTKIHIISLFIFNICILINSESLLVKLYINLPTYARRIHNLLQNFIDLHSKRITTYKIKIIRTRLDFKIINA